MSAVVSATGPAVAAATATPGSGPPQTADAATATFRALLQNATRDAGSTAPQDSGGAAKAIDAGLKTEVKPDVKTEVKTNVKPEDARTSAGPDVGPGTAADAATAPVDPAAAALAWIQIGQKLADGAPLAATGEALHTAQIAGGHRAMTGLSKGAGDASDASQTSIATGADPSDEFSGALKSAQAERAHVEPQALTAVALAPAADRDALAGVTLDAGSITHSLDGPTLPVAQPVAVTDPSATPQTPAGIADTVGAQRWGDAIAQASLGMVRQSLDRISLQMNPVHLGPLQVHVAMGPDGASLQFAAAHVETRQAMEASLATLRQVFQSQGVALSDYSVAQSFDSASGQPGQTSQERANSTRAPGTDADTGHDAAAPVDDSAGIGLLAAHAIRMRHRVDLFA